LRSPIHRIDRIHIDGGGESALSPHGRSRNDGTRIRRPIFWSAKYVLHDSSLLNFCMKSMIVSIFAMAVLI